MKSVPEIVQIARRGAVLFSTPRGSVRVSGADRVRWLNGMVSGDVAALTPGPEHSGCYALMLTPKGSIIADLHVRLATDALLLDLERDATAEVIARLERYVITEDVALADVSEEVERFALEGPQAAALLGAAGFEAQALAPEAWLSGQVGGVPVQVAAWGLSGEAAFQIFVAAGQGGALSAALQDAAGALPDLVFTLGDAEALEVLRIEAGVPRLGAELDEDVLPGEARLTERAVSFTKGCYTGQEIVARVESRGQVNHLLVALAFEGGLPAPGAALHAGDKPVGEVTSVCDSPHRGAIGLGYLRRAQAEPGTRVRWEGGTATVADLVGPGAARPAG